LETADEIKLIRFKIESIEATQQLLLRKDAGEVVSLIVESMRSRPNLAAVYVALDGTKTQREIAVETSLSEPTITRRLRDLAEEGLIEKVKETRAGVVWSKNRTVERGLRLSRELRKAGLLT